MPPGGVRPFGSVPETLNGAASFMRGTTQWEFKVRGLSSTPRVKRGLIGLMASHRAAKAESGASGVSWLPGPGCELSVILWRG